MPDVNTTHAEQHTEREVRDLLFKPDRPRTIDRFIDFFGDASTVDPRPDAASDDDDR